MSRAMQDSGLENYCVTGRLTVREIVEVINSNKEGIVFVVDEDDVLIGSISDGDIRRYILNAGSLDEQCSRMMWRNPVSVREGTSPETILELLRKHRLLSMPIVDTENRLVDLVHLRDLVPGGHGETVAIIMAGGEGKRLRPLTKDMPKPMVRIGGKPVLETIVRSLGAANIRRLYISVNYQAHVIEDYFGDGSDFGVEIVYLREDKKLGTAGPLGLLPGSVKSPILVVNGDVVTRVNFSRIVDFHLKHHCVMSIGVTEYHIKVPLGVLKLAGHYVLGIEEKPVQQFYCSAGIYVVNPEVLRHVPKLEYYDMSALIESVTRNGLPVSAFPIHEYWLDIGERENLERAEREFFAED